MDRGGPPQGGQREPAAVLRRPAITREPWAACGHAAANSGRSLMMDELAVDGQGDPLASSRSEAWKTPGISKEAACLNSTTTSSR